MVKGMLEKDPSKGFSSDAIDVLITVINCFGPLLKETELLAMEQSVMAVIDNDTAGTVVTKRALAAISTLIFHFSENQLNAFVSELVDRFNSPELATIHRRHLIATVGSIARNAPAKFGPHLKVLAPFVLSAVGEQDLQVWCFPQRALSADSCSSRCKAAIHGLCALPPSLTSRAYVRLGLHVT